MLASPLTGEGGAQRRLSPDRGSLATKSSACARPTRCAAGTRPERFLTLTSVHAFQTLRDTPGVLCRVTDGALNQLIVNVRASAYERRLRSRPKAPRAAIGASEARWARLSTYPRESRRRVVVFYGFGVILTIVTVKLRPGATKNWWTVFAGTYSASPALNL